MKIVIAGNGMVGYKFCEKLISRFGRGVFDITVYGEEPRPAYDRVHLSEYFTGTTVEDLLMAPQNWYVENQIHLITGELITEIDPDKKTITTHKGNHDTYDKLILATGSSPFVPAVPGVDKDGVFVYRTIEDLNNIIAYGKEIRRAAVLGGGLLGLEAAKALLDMNLETHVIEFASRLMPRQLDEAGSEVLKAKLESLGISIHTNRNTKEVAGNGKITSMEFVDGTSLDVEMLVISAGIKPRDELAVKSGIAVGPRGGIVVNEHMETSVKDIFAIGECALYNNMVYGLVAPGYEMAEVAIDCIAGKGERMFKGFDMSTKLKLIGVDVASFGEPFPAADHCHSIVLEDKLKGIYKRINISKDGKSLLGGILVGEAAEYNMLLQMVQNNMALPPNPEDLILGARGGESNAMGGVEALPDEAQLCSCENISKGDIVKCIVDNDFTDVAEIKKATKACTGCGGCTPLVTDLLKSTMASQGKVVKKVLCEHFDYSRQELYDLIKINSIKDYNELLEKHGKGDGCEVCKPASASMFASIWNDMILKQDTIQDTNDRFLANIQRGGTYSVIPRIPGGEITPEKLMAIGRIAKKYNLYTKITGGQRIDLLGARVDELPHIWEELIAEGFESGHAYGKALRTVKSCVGSTWCRYGVQDSVSFALEVENRYKGLRAPHKLKSAVSGCIRECAEAQSKDFGIIATEKGWNLYVCGNGGARPQHAILLAADVEKETCIKYIDRFLMYYIKTADPLTRTSTWLNKLEGGIEYLKEVIVNDSLGIGEQLETEMQGLIEKYECEWKMAVETPEIRARFTHFVNTGDSDETLKFEDMRGQKVPADWNKR